ncbi:MAG: glycoside hydrolase family 2 protein, partial [Bacteroidales bacterium]|nr:glycoside hydrolase family 2 protein [Bacteroidales bacterium]
MACLKNLLSGNNWKFRQAGTEKWMKAFVPGCVHKDLLRNNLIPDPFFGLNEKKVWWIENEDWEYKLDFRLPKGYKRFPFCELQFEGLDTFAEVWLNGKHVLSSDNMFIPHHINVTAILKKGNNILEVTFRSPYKTPLKEYNKLNYVLPANNDKGEKRVSPFARKAPYMYGWDWGPRLLTSGLYKDVRLICFDSIRFLDIHSEIQELTEKWAAIVIHFEAENLRKGEYEIHVTCDGKKVAGKRLNLDPGIVR